MKKQISIIKKGIWITGMTVFFISPVMAQRERSQSLITQDQINKITEIVKPLKDQLEKQLNADERYKAYVEDVKALNDSKSMEEKKISTERIRENYTEYFNEIWAAANVDEKSYQLRIRRVFPDNLAKLLQFEPFLNFSMSVSTLVSSPPSEPPPPDKCIDICRIAAGEITGTSDLIAAGGGAYGNCFLRTNAWSAVFGASHLISGFLRNNITIPGSFPNDARKLRVIKKYELIQEACTFAVLGGGLAETWARTYQTSEYMLVYSPVIFGSQSIKIKTMSENYLLDKKDVALSLFRTMAQTISAFVSGNWCFSECAAIKWSMCEER